MKPPAYVNKLRFGLSKPLTSLDYNTLLSNREFEPATLASLTFHRAQATSVLASVVSQGSVVPPREIQVRSPHSAAELVQELEKTLQHWTAFMDVYLSNRERMQFPGIPSFVWQSGTNGKQYGSTAAYFETIMWGDLLASVYFNAAMDYMVERRSKDGFPTQSEAELILAAYRTLRGVCADAIQKYTEIDIAASPPECSLNVCLAKMETCMLVLQHGFVRVQAVRTLELISQDSSSGAADDYVPFTMPTMSTTLKPTAAATEGTTTEQAPEDIGEQQEHEEPPMFFRGNVATVDIDWKHLGDTLQLSDIVKMTRWSETTVIMIKARLLASNVVAWDEGLECIRLESIFLKICASDWLLCTVNQGASSATTAMATANLLFGGGDEKLMFSLEDRRILRASMANFISGYLYPRVRQRTSAMSLIGRRSAWDDNTCNSDILWAVNHYEEKVAHEMGTLAVKPTSKAAPSIDNPAAERTLEEAKISIVRTRTGVDKTAFFAWGDERFDKSYKQNYYETLTRAHKIPLFLRM